MTHSQQVQTAIAMVIEDRGFDFGEVISEISRRDRRMMVQSVIEDRVTFQDAATAMIDSATEDRVVDSHSNWAD